MSRKMVLPVLSVDVDAQLRKLPARRFQRPEHYLVEWVRGALARGASNVDIVTGPRSVTVVDDGGAVGREILDDLCRALDHDLDEAVRREGLERFEQGNGLTVLSALAPVDARVALETGEGEERKVWQLSIGRRPLMLHRPDGAGTRLRLTRRGGARREQRAVEEYVRFARAEVRLNGKPLHSGAPGDALAYGRVSDPQFSGHIWIPASGDTCRLWSTSHGVRQRQRVLAATDGLVYHAAVEVAEGQVRLPVERLQAEAIALYRLLAKRYASLTQEGRTRADELLFLLHRCGGDPDLVGAFRVFRWLGAEPLANLTDVREECARGPCYGLRVEEPRSRFDIEGRRVLRLTGAQWEFLHERVGVKLLRPPEVVKRRRSGRLALRELWAAARRRRGRRLALVRPIVAPRKELVMLGDLLGRFAGDGLKVHWVSGTGPCPALIAPRNGQPGLVIFHDHPEVGRAGAALGSKPQLAPIWATRLLRGETCDTWNCRRLSSRRDDVAP